MGRDERDVGLRRKHETHKSIRRSTLITDARDPDSLGRHRVSYLAQLVARQTNESHQANPHRLQRASSFRLERRGISRAEESRRGLSRRSASARAAEDPQYSEWHRAKPPKHSRDII